MSSLSPLLTGDPAKTRLTPSAGKRRLRSVTANTRLDGEEFLQLSARFGITATTHPYPMARAQDALADLAHGRFGGAAVLHN